MCVRIRTIRTCCENDDDRRQRDLRGSRLDIVRDATIQERSAKTPQGFAAFHSFKRADLGGWSSFKSASSVKSEDRYTSSADTFHSDANRLREEYVLYCFYLFQTSPCMSFGESPLAHRILCLCTCI